MKYKSENLKTMKNQRYKYLFIFRQFQWDQFSQAFFAALLLPLLFCLALPPAIFADPHPDAPHQQPKSQSFVVEKKLPSGATWRVTLCGSMSQSGRLTEPTKLEISISGMPIQVPPAAFADLYDVALSDGVMLSEFAGETDVQFNGGEGTNAWHVKLIVRDFRMTGRELMRRNGTPTFTRYLSAPSVSGPFPLKTTKPTFIQAVQSQQI